MKFLEIMGCYRVMIIFKIIRSQSFASRSVVAKFAIVTVAMFSFSILANVSDASKLKAAKNIEYTGQKIAKAYFYIQQNIQVAAAKRNIKEGVAALNNDIAALSDNIRDDEERNMVTFLGFSNDELQQTLAQPYNVSNGALILDFSESLLEGGNLLATKYRNEDDKNEAELIVVREMSFLLERIAKYYIAFRAGFDDLNNLAQLQNAVDSFDAGLEKLNEHRGYPTRIINVLKKLNQYWAITKRFYVSLKTSSLPIIVFNSTSRLEKALKDIELFHHKRAMIARS